MLKKKCPSCGNKIEKKFSYCPYCGLGFRKKSEEENFGMLGRDDVIESQNERANEIKMPLGLNKIMNSLMKQLQNEMGNLGELSPAGSPKGFKIQISTGKPQIKPVQVQQDKKVKEIKMLEVSEKEMARREVLKRTNAESKVRRLPDRIVYEINVPGVKNKEDIVITTLEEGVEIKAYSNDKCYVKVIPLKVEILGWYLKRDVLVVELKS